jgi:hypothetical protein
MGVPDAAVFASSEISHAAFKLYVYYCARRNSKTMDCFAGNELIKEETGITYAYISTLKTELLLAGWIGKSIHHKKGVVPLKGYDASMLEHVKLSTIERTSDNKVSIIERNQAHETNAQAKVSTIKTNLSTVESSQPESSKVSMIERTLSDETFDHRKNSTPSSENLSTIEINSFDDRNPPYKDEPLEGTNTEEEIDIVARVDAVLLDYSATVNRDISDLHHQTLRSWRLLIQNRLQESWDERKLHQIFVGCSKDDWPQRKKYNSIPDLLTKIETMDRMINLAKVADEIKTATGVNGNGKAASTYTKSRVTRDFSKYPKRA